jgi:hypothetical protein
MPLALPDLQAAFAAHLAGEDRAELVACVRGDSISAAARLSVHRHNMLHSLANALAATFPTVQAMVGEAFFRGMARAFITDNLPTGPVLAEYGATFATFVAHYEPAKGLPYLADIARLDWALNTAFHSPAAVALTPADLAAIAVEQLPGNTVSLTAGATVIRSAYPIDRIWAAAQPGAPDEKVDIESGASCLLVLRRADDAGFVALSAGEAEFLEALAGTRTLEQAASAALAAESVFDLSSTFARFLALRVFAAVQ